MVFRIRTILSLSGEIAPRLPDGGFDRLAVIPEADGDSGLLGTAAGQGVHVGRSKSILSTSRWVTKSASPTPRALPAVVVREVTDHDAFHAGDSPALGQERQEDPADDLGVHPRPADFLADLVDDEEVDIRKRQGGAPVFWLPSKAPFRLASIFSGPSTRSFAVWP